MSEYIIHNIGLTVVPQFDFDENEEKDKPVSLFPNFYLGKIIGKKGSELSINRTRRGEGEEHIPNCVLRNENGIALIRIHNKENLTIYDLPDSTEKEVQDCIGTSQYSYPYAYVIVDYRNERCQIAIEKSSAWDRNTKTIRNGLEIFFNDKLYSSMGIHTTIKEKTIRTQFEDFIDCRTIDYGDIIEEFKKKEKMTKRFQQNQRDKLKEHFKNHIFYRLCREVRDVFLQQYPAIIISTENLFVDAAKELDIILSDGDIDADYCKDMWTNSLTIYREQDNTLAEVATSQAEVAMLLYTIMFGINAVNHSHYRGKLQRTLHESIHKMWKCNNQPACIAIEIKLKESVNQYTEEMMGWMKEYFVSQSNLTEEINETLSPKKNNHPKKNCKSSEEYPTFLYNCKNQETRVKRINLVMRKMQEWEWIEEPRYAEDFEHLFDGENRNCNIRWIGKPLVILTELTKRLLKQSYMDEQKGVSASSIVQKQFGKNRSSNTDRLDENAEKQINTILYILDYKKELPDSIGESVPL